MGHTYAGILGPLAFTFILLRGVIDGGDVATTLAVASGCLFLFAAIGYLVGRIADSIVLETVKVKLDAELKAREEPLETT